MSGWRRTERGWEKADRWPRPRRPLNPIQHLHPLVVAAGMTLISIMALVACEPSGQRT